MEANTTSKHSDRKELECKDCGFLNFVYTHEHSFKCQNCGNIEFVEMAKVRELTPEPLHAPRPQSNNKLSDGLKVQEIIEKYQTEWQMWSVLVQNFANQEMHAAYLSISLLENKVDLATERYNKHRSVMILNKETMWQAEIADYYIERLQQVAFVRVEQEGKKWSMLPEWFFLFPQHSSVIRIGWIVMGILLAAKAFRYI